MRSMKVMVEGVGSFGVAVEMPLEQLLTPNMLGKFNERDLACCVGRLGALLVMKGVCTIQEAQEACGVDTLKVVGKPTGMKT